jgi:hypothetical protein
MVGQQLGLGGDRVYNNIERFGNTTAATIPIAIDECVQSGRLKRGDLLVLTGFGSGFTWGSACVFSSAGRHEASSRSPLVSLSRPRSVASLPSRRFRDRPRCWGSSRVPITSSRTTTS